MLPIDDPEKAVLKAVRAVFFVRFYAAPDTKPVDGCAKLTLRIGNETAEEALPLSVTRAFVPPAGESGFSVNNWLSYSDIAAQHNAEQGSERWLTLLDAYLDALLELRGTELKLPSGEPIRDESGRVIGFDFSLCGTVAEHALRKGFKFVLGGFVARFKVWDESDHFLLWDRDVSVTSREGYRQLKLYYTTLWALVVSHGWQEQWQQCLVDEPQFPNSLAYRALSGICRKCMPGVIINDPVESTDLEGAADIWCVKQAVYDKYRDSFRDLRSLGETITVYTCGYPGGKWMNRSTDLPLAAGRLVFWMCAKEHFAGFLHWGYNAGGGLDPWKYNCHPVNGTTRMTPGNGFIVYPAENGPAHSLRSQIQLFGAEDCELLRQLPEETMQSLCAKLATDFEHYDPDPAHLSAVRAQLLTAF